MIFNNVFLSSKAFGRTQKSGSALKEGYEEEKTDKRNRTISILTIHTTTVFTFRNQFKGI